MVPRATRHRAPGGAERGRYIVRFSGPVEEAWKEAVAARGGEILEYVPEFAFKVRMSPTQARQVRRRGRALGGLLPPRLQAEPPARGSGM